MAACTQHCKHPSFNPFFFLAKFSGPWYKGLAASSHPVLQHFLLNCCCILLVCWLIILVLFSWFGFNFPFQWAFRARRAPTVCLEGGYFQSTVHIGWNSVSIEIWWHSSHLLQWERFLISGTQTVLFFLFLWVCSADISSSLPPFFSPCSWTDDGFQRTLGNVVCCKHLVVFTWGGLSLGFFAKPNYSGVIALSTKKMDKQYLSAGFYRDPSPHGHVYRPKAVQYIVLVTALWWDFMQDPGIAS